MADETQIKGAALLAGPYRDKQPLQPAEKANLNRLSESLPPKQLSMVLTADRARMMPDFILPPGYELRGYLPGDEASWIEVINTGEFGSQWNRTHFDRYITQPVRRDGSRLVVRDGKVIAATFASVHGGSENLGRLDDVVALPDYRGLGLGRAVCTEVVRYLVGRGYSGVFLFTDDWRLPAIGLYLSMGFEPQMNREDMRGRWDRIRAQLEVARRQ